MATRELGGGMLSLLRRLAVLALLLGLLPGSGCGGGPPLLPVSGKVTLDGQPLTGGGVTLVPQNADKDSKVPPPVGQIDANGQYVIYTGGRAGAPEGKYKVTVTPPTRVEVSKGVPKLPFPKEYSDGRRTPLVIEVVPSAAAGAYDLKMKK
jgi:hypothetical protein